MPQHTRYCSECAQHGIRTTVPRGHLLCDPCMALVAGPGGRGAVDRDIRESRTYGRVIIRDPAGILAEMAAARRAAHA